MLLTHLILIEKSLIIYRWNRLDETFPTVPGTFSADFSLGSYSNICFSGFSVGHFAFLRPTSQVEVSTKRSKLWIDVSVSPSSFHPHIFCSLWLSICGDTIFGVFFLWGEIFRDLRLENCDNLIGALITFYSYYGGGCFLAAFGLCLVVPWTVIWIFLIEDWRFAVGYGAHGAAAFVAGDTWLLFCSVPSIPLDCGGLLPSLYLLGSSAWAYFMGFW